MSGPDYKALYAASQAKLKDEQAKLKAEQTNVLVRDIELKVMGAELKAVHAKNADLSKEKVPHTPFSFDNCGLFSFSQQQQPTLP